MADYDIAAVTRRAVYSGSAGTGPYAFSFACLETSDIAVYKDTTLLTETSDYTVTLSASTGTGSITLGSAANSNNTITLVGARDLARTTDFVTAGSLTASALNTDFDSLVIFAQQLSEENSRNLKAPVTEGISGTTDMTIPPKATRASKMLEFDSDGNPAVSIPATNLATLGTITGNITTVAGIASNVTTVAGIASNVTAVAGDATDIGAVAAVATEIGRLGTSAAVADLAILGTSAIVTDMDLLATSANVAAMGHLGTSANVTAMGLLGTSAVVADMALLGTSDVVADMALLATSDVIADMNTLATSDIVSDINTLATSDIVSDLNTLATSDIVSDINTLATSDIVSDLNTLATSDIVSDINTLATSDIVSDLNTLATSDFVSDLNTLASSTVVTNIATVASNVAGVNSFAERYRVGSSDPTSSLDEGDLFYNSSDNAVKYYNGSAWASITAGIGNVVEDTTPQLGGNLASNGNDIVFADDDKAIFGSDTDLTIRHNGTHGIIDNNTGDLFLQSDTVVRIVNSAASETAAKFFEDGAVELYHDNSRKIKTTSSGAEITGNVVLSDNGKAIFGAGSDLQIFHDGSDSYVKDAGTGRLVVETDGTDVSLKAGSDNMLVAAKDGAVTLYYDNAAKLATSSTGVDVTGVITTDGMTTSADVNFGDDDKAIFGAGSDLQIYHDGSDSYIAEGGSGTGSLKIKANNLLAYNNSDAPYFQGVTGGTFRIYHDGNQKLSTTATGVDVTGTLNATTVDLGNWTITESSGVLFFATSGTNKMKLDASGNLTVVGDITAFGSM